MAWVESSCPSDCGIVWGDDNNSHRPPKQSHNHLGSYSRPRPSLFFKVCYRDQNHLDWTYVWNTLCAILVECHPLLELSTFLFCFDSKKFVWKSRTSTFEAQVDLDHSRIGNPLHMGQRVLITLRRYLKSPFAYNNLLTITINSIHLLTTNISAI